MVMPLVWHSFKLLNKAIQKCNDKGGCSKSLRKQFTGEINTNKFIQTDLQNLYGGFEISPSDFYSKVTVAFLALTIYASGMPLLYPIALLTFVLIYLFHKCVVLKHYRKSKMFNEDLPLLSIVFIKWSIFFHILLSTLILCTDSIIFIENNSFIGWMKENNLSLLHYYVINN